MSDGYRELVLTLQNIVYSDSELNFIIKERNIILFGIEQICEGNLTEEFSKETTYRNSILIRKSTVDYLENLGYNLFRQFESSQDSVYYERTFLTESGNIYKTYKFVTMMHYSLDIYCYTMPPPSSRRRYPTVSSTIFVSNRSDNQNSSDSTEDNPLDNNQNGFEYFPDVSHLVSSGPRSSSGSIWGSRSRLPTALVEPISDTFWNNFSSEELSSSDSEGAREPGGLFVKLATLSSTQSRSNSTSGGSIPDEMRASPNLMEVDNLKSGIPGMSGEGAVPMFTDDLGLSDEGTVVTRTGNLGISDEDTIAIRTGNPRMSDEDTVARTGSPRMSDEDTIAIRTGSPRMSDEDTIAMRTGSPRISDEDTVARTGSPRMSDEDTIAMRTGNPRMSDEDTVARTGSPRMSDEDTIAIRTGSPRMSDEDTIAMRTGSPRISDDGTVARRTGNPRMSDEDTVVRTTGKPGMPVSGEPCENRSSLNQIENGLNSAPSHHSFDGIFSQNETTTTNEYISADQIQDENYLIEMFDPNEDLPLDNFLTDTDENDTGVNGVLSIETIERRVAFSSFLGPNRITESLQYPDIDHEQLMEAPKNRLNPNNRGFLPPMYVPLVWSRKCQDLQYLLSLKLTHPYSYIQEYNRIRKSNFSMLDCLRKRERSGALNQTKVMEVIAEPHYNIYPPADEEDIRNLLENVQDEEMDLDGYLMVGLKTRRSFCSHPLNLS